MPAPTFSDDTLPLGKRARSKELNRRKLILTAYTLFSWKKYEEVSLRDVGREAGLSTGAIFAAFESKEALWAATFGRPYIHPEDQVQNICMAVLEADDVTVEIGGDAIVPFHLWAEIVRQAFPDGLPTAPAAQVEPTPEPANDDAPERSAA